jgi:hypothetical protein
MRRPSIDAMLSSAPSTAANWVNSGSPYCINGTEYQLKIDNNPCSSEYNTTDEVATGDNSECWQISDLYYLTCADAKSLSNPYQSYVLNGFYKYKTVGNNENWQIASTLMTGDWYFNSTSDGLSRKRTFFDTLLDAGKINTTELSECTTSGGGGDEELPGG